MLEKIFGSVGASSIFIAPLVCLPAIISIGYSLATEQELSWFDIFCGIAAIVILSGWVVTVWDCMRIKPEAKSYKELAIDAAKLKIKKKATEVIGREGSES
ncbi:hypothetical protein [Shewanella sp. UCD-KL12]|uniref:hypothetical protein n=1 Tax=Shewanella sp. UCD-KL12 TaxID=1917163 RepID=UPI000970C1F2|nr:hypothetical protein [Shewanella sp. UCD-KL12]